MCIHDAYGSIFAISGLDLQSHIADAMRADGIPFNFEHSMIAKSMARRIIMSKSDNTTKKYFNVFQNWCKYCESKQFAKLPASPMCIAIYITELLDKGSSYHTISAIVYAVKWVHSINNFTDPTDNSFIKNLLESAKRTAKQTVKRKDIVTSEMLISLCNMYMDCEDLCIVRNLCMVTLSYAGFLRFNEMSNIRCKDISFSGTHACIFIVKSKTDQYRDGNQIVIEEGHSSACPIKMLKRYMGLAQLKVGCDSFLFKPICKSKGLSKLVGKDKPISYTRAREIVISLFKTIEPTLDIGLHSLRAGGATAAANSKVDTRCLKRHGRWKTDVAKDMYIKDSMESRLEVSKSLNI